MTADPAGVKGPTASFQLKGGMITVTALHLLHDDLERFAKELAAKVRQNPKLFQGMPVVIDLQAVKDDSGGVDVARVALLLGDQGMIPLGVRNGSEVQREAAQGFGLAVLPDNEGARPARGAAESRRAAEPQQTRSESAAATRVVTQPVRSGQQIYAEGDLIVLASVSPGAEILADGHIHVYGGLHGRALAGVKGDTEARIFCRKLYAELLSVAGIYRVYEDLDSDLRGQPVQVFLNEQQLMTEIL